MKNLRALDVVPLETCALATLPESVAVILLNEIGSKVVEMAKMGFERTEIAVVLAELSGNPESSVIADIVALDQSVQTAIEEAEQKSPNFTTYSTQENTVDASTYLLFGKAFRFEYPDTSFGSFLHPFFSPFEIADTPDACVVSFENASDECNVSCGETCRTCENHAAATMGAVCEALLFHDQPNRPAPDAYLHCGAVLGSKGAWLISGASGHGKTTLTLTLDAAGFTVLSDDILPIDLSAGLVFPVPFAVSVKPGSWERLSRSHPSLTTREARVSASGKSVKMVSPIHTPISEHRSGIPIAGFLYPNRAPNIAHPNVSAISFEQALLGLCDEFGRFPSEHDDLSALAEWVKRSARYKLDYTDAEDIVTLLGHML